ncbi:alpha/beta fold hydrolase [Nonomuraea sp. KC401]|uniref:alpha/beta fold hydrolase n=1 Tax=unclassified Nonomuraea TaxID=2593643 RepID=UPI0010FCE05E|nr:MULTISPECIES: alpha/beta fold hydrolase [unclassified Nonomuraea]NBE97967.1 alpha/beta fold hydrolase [Nonomuraea sp. K271]TLF57082.1 alpha/beta fold hydrolase [Nonomuraea sp. KC401]
MPSATPLLFVHGFWHGSWCWSEVVPHVVAAGRLAVAVDMAGHGLYARRPRWFTEQPYDPEAVGTEVSPVANVTLDDAAALLTSQIKQIGGGEPVTVVAHSAAGPVLTRVAQQQPELVAHAVYVAAYMPASGVPAAAYSELPEAADGLVVPLVQGDPARIGAIRLDFATGDPVYRRRLYEAFYGDVDRALADAATGLLTPDGPAGVMVGTTTLTRDGWGSVRRTYVTCTKDRAITPTVQATFVAEADAAFPDNPTSVVTLDASHSPFFSMPDVLADVVTSLG